VKKLVAVLFAAAAVLTVAAVASARPAQEIMAGATLTAKQEIPKQVVQNAKAKGAFTADIVGTKLTWRLTFSGLTGKALQAHIHVGAMGKAGNVLVPLCAPCKNGQKGTAKISPMVVQEIQKHLAYVNVHTAKNPNGEIRGQLAAH
jgi:hypothetical protein